MGRVVLLEHSDIIAVWILDKHVHIIRTECCGHCLVLLVVCALLSVSHYLTALTLLVIHPVPSLARLGDGGCFLLGGSSFPAELVSLCEGRD